MHLTSPLLAAVPGVLHGFGGAGEGVPAPFAARFPHDFPRWKQVHGAHAALRARFAHHPEYRDGWINVPARAGVGFALVEGEG